MNAQINQTTALYCRLAHYFDDMDRTATWAQMAAVWQYAEEHGLEHPRLFCDWGSSGSTLDRPEFQRMYREIKSGNVTDIVITNICRLGRNQIEVGHFVNVTLQQFNVTLHTTQDGIYQFRSAISLEDIALLCDR